MKRKPYMLWAAYLNDAYEVPASRGSRVCDQDSDESPEKFIGS